MNIMFAQTDEEEKEEEEAVNTFIYLWWWLQTQGTPIATNRRKCSD
jgi:hypothetical protein